MDNTNLDRIAEALEQIAEQAAPWQRTRVSAPTVFADRRGRRVYVTSRGADVGVVALAKGVESVVFDGTWPQCRRFMDRLFREDITARAVAASAEEAPAEPAITWQLLPHGSLAGVARSVDGCESREYRIGRVASCTGSRPAYVWGAGVLHDIAECADEAAAKALCEAWERAFLAATKEVQS